MHACELASQARTIAGFERMTLKSISPLFRYSCADEFILIIDARQQMFPELTTECPSVSILRLMKL